MSSKGDSGLIRVGISVGDTNGIGLEVVIKSLLDPRFLEDIIPIIYANAEVVKIHRKTVTEAADFAFHTVENADQALPRKVNLVNAWQEKTEVKFGSPTKDSASAALKSLETAVADMASNKIDVLVTAPIDKDNISKAGFKFPGHTEYLASMSRVDDYLMLLVNGGIRVGVVTGHIPLKDVSQSLSKQLIVKKVKKMAESLEKDFGIRKPKIAVLGLNPHAGDNGLLGAEEKEIINPAVRELQEEGLMVYGSYAADGLFGSNNFKNFDGVMAMYHDQGLAPFKAIAFEYGVNFTAGLPIVRTSPDHGTAFSIAGKNEASESSFREAIYVACDVYRKRREYKEITANPLQPRKLERDRDN